MSRLIQREAAGAWRVQGIAWEDMIGHVCDNLCYHRRKVKVQEELDEICADCPVSACMTRLLGLTEK